MAAHRRALALAIAEIVLFASLGVGCAPPATPAGGGSCDIARVHRSRCGTCHTRVEPGTRTRAQLEAALSRHRSRVRLTEAQWAQMIDYLAATNALAGKDSN